MTRSHHWAAPAAVVALVAVSGCGGHGGPDARAQREASGSPTAALPGAPLSTGPSGGATGPAYAAPGSPPPGSYDDTGSSGRAPRTQRPVLDHLPGARTGCVPVGARSSVRSGDLAMGDFAQARADFRATHGAYDAEPSHFFVIPQARTARRTTVTLTRVGGGAPAIRTSADHLEDAAQWKYFPVSAKITRPGTWRFTVRVGASTGCFLATFTS
jgi:hypothetical protein